MLNTNQNERIHQNKQRTNGDQQLPPTGINRREIASAVQFFPEQSRAGDNLSNNQPA